MLRLERQENTSGLTWRLREVSLEVPYRKRYDRGSVDDWLESYSSDASPHRFQFLGAVRDGQVLGLLTWEHSRWNETIWLTDIRVRHEERRKGVGTQLIRCLKEEARSLRARGIALETQINNLPAIRFYEREGFTIAGFNDHLYSNRDFEDQDVALFLFWEAETT